MNVIHRGKYSGMALNKLIETKLLFDNRILHVESFVKPGVEYHAKSLTQKGWRKKPNIFSQSDLETLGYSQEVE